MKKIAIVCILVLMILTSCGKSNDSRIKYRKVVGDFGIDLNTTDLQILYNSYDGFPYEGMALYSFEVTDEMKDAINDWDATPYSKNVEEYLESISFYIQLPEIKNGKWKIIDRKPDTKGYTNISFCVYDIDNKCAYIIETDS